MRPTAFMSPTCAMPVTTTRKINGAIVILISEMKASPSGLKSTATLGARKPNSAPSAAPATTRTYGSRQSGLRRRSETGVDSGSDSGVAAICNFVSSNGIFAPCRDGALFLSCYAVYIGPAAWQALMPYRYDLRTKRYYGPDLAGGLPCHRRGGRVLPRRRATACDPAGAEPPHQVARGVAGHAAVRALD